MRPPDAAFADPRLAVHYDFFDGDRSDLDAYAAIVTEVGAKSVLDVGCGTGSLAVRLAGEGIEVVGVDPAAASLDIARTKPHAERVRWVEGDASTVRALGVSVDLAVMTGNVAQVFVDDADWHLTLESVRDCLKPGGWLVFETRRPEVRAWEDWDQSPTTVAMPDGSSAVLSLTVTEASMPLVTFDSTTVIDGVPLASSSTLRFRERDELERDLTDHGLQVVDVRDAPDRPGLEWVFVAQCV